MSHQLRSSSSSPDFNENYAFKKVFRALGISPQGPLDQPLFTRERLEALSKGLRELQSKGENEGQAHMVFRDIFNVPITLSLMRFPNIEMKILRVHNDQGQEATLRLHVDDIIYVSYKGIMEVTTNDVEKEKQPPPIQEAFRPGGPALPPQDDPEQQGNFAYIQRHSPFHIDTFRPMMFNDVIPQHFSERVKQLRSEWEGSNLREELTTALEKGPKTTREVRKIVCFGMGNPFDHEERKSCRHVIQHLAAQTIKKTLSKIQKNQINIDIISQEIEYPTDDPSKKHLKDAFDIQTVDWTVGEALTHVDARTIVVAIFVDPPIIEAAIDMAYPNGPVGLLSAKMIINEEAENLGYETPSPDDPDMEFLDNEVCVPDRVWKYRESCVRFPAVTDKKWFGLPLDPKGGGSHVKYRYDTELLLRRN